jgi:hypothetical protein
MKKFYFLFSALFIYTLAANAQTNNDFTTFPISLKYFQAKKSIQGNQLQWLAPCITTEATFEIQHSADGRNFLTIETITADQLRCTQPFDYFDLLRNEGTQYYRIKMIALSNVSINSFVVAVFNGSKGFELNAMLPSVVQSSASLNVSSAINDMLQLYVTDFTGKRHLILNKQVVSGNNRITLDFSVLPKGQYILNAINNDKDIKKIKFIKQ